MGEAIGKYCKDVTGGLTYGKKITLRHNGGGLIVSGKDAFGYLSFRLSTGQTTKLNKKFLSELYQRTYTVEVAAGDMVRDANRATLAALAQNLKPNDNVCYTGQPKTSVTFKDGKYILKKITIWVTKHKFYPSNSDLNAHGLLDKLPFDINLKIETSKPFLVSSNIQWSTFNSATFSHAAKP